MRLRPVLTILLALAIGAPPALAQERVRHEQGEFEYLASTTGVVIAAPHGTHDINTGPIAIGVARRLGAGYVVFRGTAPGLRINVNRPTEGAGRACPNEPPTDRARSAYDAYVRVVRTAAGIDRVPLYVEIHGNAEPRTAQNIEVASKGITAADAGALKDAYPGILTVVRREWPSFPALALLIEPADRIFFTASCAKALGIFATEMIPRALHFEFPRAAREETALEATATLVAGLLRSLPRFR